jgi:UTP--glucose-1-phosphate uridylyltransferase
MLPVGNNPAVEHVVNECAGAATVVVATRPGDLVVPSYLDVLRRDGVPVEAVTEDLRHGYGNGTPLLTLRDRLAAQESFGVVDIYTEDPSRVAGIRQRPDPATVSEPLALVSRLILRSSIFDLLVPTGAGRTRHGRTSVA